VDYALHIAVLIMIWSTLALSQGLLTGYLGVLAVHQAAAWGVGAYTAALLSRLWHLPLGLTAIPGALAAGVLMLAIGGVVAAGRRDDQVIASLCIQILVIESLLNFTGLTGGSFGISGIELGFAGGQRERMYAVLIAGAVLLVATLGLYAALRRTRLPQEWVLVRDYRPAAEAVGIDAGAARATALFLSAAIAGASGTLFAHYATFIEPQTFGLAESVAILSIAVIGRAPSTWGVLLAALVIVLMPEALRALGLSGELTANIRQALFGVLLVSAIFWLRR